MCPNALHLLHLLKEALAAMLARQWGNMQTSAHRGDCGSVGRTVAVVVVIIIIYPQGD